MRSRDDESSKQSAKIIDPGAPVIDVEANPPDAADSVRLPPQTFRERHALKILGVVMAAMFATVIAAQVGC